MVLGLEGKVFFWELATLIDVMLFGHWVDLGVAIGAGTDVAVESADIVLVRSDPRNVADVMELSRATYRKMIQNLLWAIGYNAVAIPLAAGVAYGVGILPSPAVGAALMSVSTVVVAINARLLKRFRPGE